MTEDELRNFLDAAADPAFADMLGAAIEADLANPKMAGFSSTAQMETGLAKLKVAMQQKGKWRIPAIFRYAAAAVILLSAGIYFLQKPEPAVVNTVSNIPDIQPGTNKATLTLADGSVIALDSNGNRTISEGVRQRGAELLYDKKSTAVSFNTLSTPRGGQFQVQLPDGSKAWLNAASSIRYPTAFSGKERKVFVSGEVYFEIAANASMPFRVAVDELPVIEVLGTSFNVNAYGEEPASTVTLLEGGVRVTKGQHQVTLQPGQQAQWSDGKPGIRLSKANTAQVMAWRNGLFDFQDKSLEEVMRQLARWYDIEVVYEGRIPHIEFGGKIKRDMTLAQLLVFLEKSDVHFSMEENRKLIVKP